MCLLIYESITDITTPPTGIHEEINPFISILRSHGIGITSLHNHWLFDCPRLMYIYFESIDFPLEFARKVADALKVLRK